MHNMRLMQLDAKTAAAMAQAKAEMETVVKKGQPVHMSRENANAILDGKTNAFVKVGSLPLLPLEMQHAQF
jgi:hypothetical protein